jgi:hypothetical protein
VDAFFYIPYSQNDRDLSAENCSHSVQSSIKCSVYVVILDSDFDTICRISQDRMWIKWICLTDLNLNEILFHENCIL